MKKFKFEEIKGCPIPASIWEIYKEEEKKNESGL